MILILSFISLGVFAKEGDQYCSIYRYMGTNGDHVVMEFEEKIGVDGPYLKPLKAKSGIMGVDNAISELVNDETCITRMPTNPKLRRCLIIYNEINSSFFLQQASIILTTGDLITTVRVRNKLREIGACP